jgi:hypothetical protein
MTKQEVTVFEFKNEKQANFHDTVMKAVAKLNNLRYFFYGGAIRGGKTFVCLYIFVKLAKLFPRSRWHIFRSDFPELEDTTIPSMEKLIGTEGKDFVWKRKSSNYHILFANGSKIFFKSENLMKDSDLKWMLGLETNGILLEQMEGLSEQLMQRAIERVGSWVLKDMPIPIIMGTFNPTNTWVKKDIYDRYLKGTLPENYYFEEALPEHNPFVTDEQWKNWQNLDEISYNQLIKGVWKFLTDAKLFAYAFESERNVIDVSVEGSANWQYMQPIKSLPVYAIFDFNVDPVTCLIGQRQRMDWAKIMQEYRLRNSDIYELLERVKTDWEDYYLIATGDASGRARSALTRGNRTYVKTIQKELRLSPKQMQFPTVNPSIANTRMLMNSLFKKHPRFHIASRCQFLIDDLETVTAEMKNDRLVIEKGKDKLKTHLLDNLRYFDWNYFRKFISSYS